MIANGDYQWQGFSMLDNERWNRLISKLCKGYLDGRWFNELVSDYGQEHRHYHGMNHIIHCLNEFDQAVAIAHSPHEVEFAIWLHDAVYNPQASDNEEKSAVLAGHILSSMGAYQAAIQRIKALILATRPNEVPVTRDAMLLVDIDLSTLGYPPEVYDRYERAIRAEYAWAPMEVFRQARREILDGFLQRS